MRARIQYCVEPLTAVVAQSVSASRSESEDTSNDVMTCRTSVLVNELEPSDKLGTAAHVAPFQYSKTTVSPDPTPAVPVAFSRTMLSNGVP